MRFINRLTNQLNHHPLLAIATVLAMVIVVREVFLGLATAFGLPSIGNILGMVFLLVVLLVWRATHGLPNWLILSSNRILTESALAYLPVSAGAGILLFELGNDFWPVMLVTFLATVPLLWILVRLADYWLHHRLDGSEVDDYASDVAKLGVPIEADGIELGNVEKETDSFQSSHSTQTSNANPKDKSSDS